MKIRKEYIFAGISIIFWGSSAAVSALMLESLSSFAVLFYGSILASAFLFVLCALTGRLKKLKDIPLKDWIFMIALGVLGMFLGVPIVAVFRYLILKLLDYRLSKRNLSGVKDLPVE